VFELGDGGVDLPVCDDVKADRLMRVLLAAPERYLRALDADHR
jgi:hypothetical protein